MKKYLSVILAAILFVSIFSSCKKSDETKTPFDVKAEEVFTVKVSMNDSGSFNSMALTIYSDDEAFDIIDGKWLNQQAVIADFNKENKDAAIAFKEETNYCGEIFEFTVKSKKDLTIIDNMFEVEPIIKNEQGKINCESITLSYAKN